MKRHLRMGSAMLALLALVGCAGPGHLGRHELPADDQGVALFRVKLEGAPEASVAIYRQANMDHWWPQGNASMFPRVEGYIQVKAGDALYAVALKEDTYELPWVVVGSKSTVLREARSACSTFDIRRGHNNFIGTLLMRVNSPQVLQLSCTDLDAGSPEMEAMLHEAYPAIQEMYPTRQTSFGPEQVRPRLATESSDEGMKFHVLLTFFGMQFGGEPFTNLSGKTSQLTAGNAVNFSGGLMLEPYRGTTHSLQVQATGGYNFAVNGSTAFSHWPVELLGFYYHRPSGLRVGGGPQYQVGTTLKRAGVPSHFHNALGLVLQSDWLFSRYVSVYGRYTFINYSPTGGSRSISGNAVGFGMTLFIPGVD